MAADDPERAQRLKEAQAWFDGATRFNFFQAVKLVEAYVRVLRREAGEPEPEPLGATNDPDQEAMTIRATASLAFRPSDLSRIDLAPRGSDRPRMEVDFLSLSGARGPLPLFYSELIRSRWRAGDTAMRDFVDLFNHRIVGLLFRVRQRNRPTLHTGPLETHPFAQYMLSFCGLRGEATLASVGAEDAKGGPAGITPKDVIYYAGLLWHRERSMHGLEQMLTHFYKFPVRGRQLQGRWITLAGEARSALSAKPHHNRLGVSAIAGGRIWDPQAGFDLLLGPLSWQDFIDFLPSGTNFSGFARLVRYYVRGAFDFGTRITLKAPEVFPNRPAVSATGTNLRLAWTSWLLTKPLAGELINVQTSGRLINYDPPPLRKVGIAGLLPPARTEALTAAIKAEFARLGYVEGETVEYVERSANGKISQARTVAREMLAAAPEITFTLGTPMARALAAAGLPRQLLVGARSALEDSPDLVAEAQKLSDDERTGGLLDGWSLDGRDELLRLISPTPRIGDRVGLVLEEWPVNDVFGLIRGALPRLGKLALLHDPRAFAWRGRPLPEVGQRPPSRLERVRQAAARLGIELMEVSIAAPGEAYAAARKALTSADALFISVDAVVVLGSTGALRAAMEARKPAFGGLESLVRQGALGAVVPSPARLGTVGARVAHAALLGASLAATVAPEASEIAINQRAADVLGVRLPARLLERAVRVYEAIEEPSSANA